MNKRQRSRTAYLNALALQGVNANATDANTPEAIQLLQHVSIPSLPGYLEGWFSVQDLNAQRCAALFNDAADFNKDSKGLDGKVVLDACAAPGGKTAHLLEQYTPQKLIALDSDSYRLKRVRENLNRLELFDQTRRTTRRIQQNRINWRFRDPFTGISCCYRHAGLIKQFQTIEILANAF